MDRHPHNVFARSNASNFLLAANDLEGSVRIGKDLVAGASSFPACTLLYVAVADVLLGRREEALDYYARLGGLDASYAATATADLAMFDGRLDEAEAILRKAMGADASNNKPAQAAAKRAMLAEVRLAKGDRAGAILAAENSVTSGEPPTAYAAAEVELAAGRVERALAIAAPPEGGARDAELLGRLVQADALRVRGKLPEAVDAFRAAKEKGDSWLVHLGLGRTYLALGDDANALAELQICDARQGEAAIVFLDDAPTLRYAALGRRELERLRARLHADAAPNR
jgi:tetratricopeptide (TPR) repeat protein